ncbi:MAG: (p)ppGpp synthetase [Lachnospiraceae bacterium]|nr:(p)ppGpp synthetase [Lachnospiraceae bacterium]
MTDKEYYDFVHPYRDAMQMLLTRLDVLNHSLYKTSYSEPIHNIQDRIKSKLSLEEKLERKGKTPSVMNAKDYLKDIAGIRVICYFVSDIYNLIDNLKMQSDLIIVQERDYIANPKENGYRSYHVIVGVPVYCLDGMEYFPVEVQFRTMSMDFWASMEHRVSYKKEVENREQMREELKDYAQQLMEIERRFEGFSEKGQLKTQNDSERFGQRNKV